MSPSTATPQITPQSRDWSSFDADLKKADAHPAQAPAGANPAAFRTRSKPTILSKTCAPRCRSNARQRAGEAILAQQRKHSVLPLRAQIVTERRSRFVAETQGAAAKPKRRR